MGLVERGLAKTQARIAEIARTRLEPGDEVQVSVSATTPLSFWLMVLCVFPVVLVINLSAYDAWSPLFLGLAFGILYAVTVRARYVVLSSRHLLVVKLGFLSSTKVTEEHLVDISDVEAELKQRTMTDLLTIRSHAFTEKLQVAGPYRARAAELVRKLHAPADAHDETE